VTTVNLLQPKGFLQFSGYLLSDPFPQPIPQSLFPQKLFSRIRTTRTTAGAAEFPGVQSLGVFFWELVRLFDSGQPKSEAVLRYLAAAEAREVNPYLADDVRIAWLTVLHAAAGASDAWGYSFWQFFGKTYPKALLAWAEREEINRKALERCAAMIRAERQAREGSPLCGEGAEKPAPALPRGASLGLAGNLYDSARAVLEFPSPKDRKRAA
jgi:hypothetical protein